MKINQIVKTLLFLGLLSSQCIANDTSFNKKFGHVQPEIITKALSQELAKNLPQRIDSMTTTISAVAIKDTVTVTNLVDANEIDANKAMDLPSTKDYLHNMNIGRFCNHPQYHYFLTQKNIKFKYYYMSSDAKELFRFMVTKKDCKANK